MRYHWLDEYLLSKKGVTKDLQPAWNWVRYHVGGKMFAAVCLDGQNRPYYINLKLEPMEGEFLRSQYEDIIPGYYSNKVHWNSINPDGAVPDELLKDLLDKSYQLVLGGLSKKRQREILEDKSCDGTGSKPENLEDKGRDGTDSKPEKRDTKMTFDYKKEYKEFYLPPRTPGIVEVPEMNYIAVRGAGDPNQEDGEYKAAMSLLYGIAFTIKMSYKGSHKIEGYFPYVVPPLEGLWWQEEAGKLDLSHKEKLQWISMIRLPEFVTEEEFRWALEEAAAKKKSDFSKVEFFTYREGTCVQCMHIGPYDDEPATIQKMLSFAEEQGYKPDLGPGRLHHEIYLSDPRKAAPEKLRTVIRQPVKRRP